MSALSNNNQKNLTIYNYTHNFNRNSDMVRGQSFGMPVTSPEALQHHGKMLLASGKYHLFSYNPNSKKITSVNIPPLKLSTDHISHLIFVAKDANKSPSLTVQMDSATGTSTQPAHNLGDALGTAFSNSQQTSHLHPHRVTLHTIYTTQQRPQISVPPKMNQPILFSRL